MTVSNFDIPYDERTNVGDESKAERPGFILLTISRFTATLNT